MTPACSTRCPSRSTLGYRRCLTTGPRSRLRSSCMRSFSESSTPFRSPFTASQPSTQGASTL
eukprot:6176816-Pleurochrysis_carterae.AAC.3